MGYPDSARLNPTGSGSWLQSCQGPRFEWGRRLTIPIGVGIVFFSSGGCNSAVFSMRLEGNLEKSMRNIRLNSEKLLLRDKRLQNASENLLLLFQKHAFFKTNGYFPLLHQFKIFGIRIQVAVIIHIPTRDRDRNYDLDGIFSGSRSFSQSRKSGFEWRQ